MEWLKIEVEIIQSIIARHDEITQTTKNWAMITWAGSIGLLISQADLRIFLIFTSIPPLLFWFIDTSWRRLQKRSIYRQ